MNSKVEADICEKDLILSFENKPEAVVRVKLNMYRFTASNLNDTEYIIKNFELNHENGILALKYLENKANYEILCTEDLDFFLKNLVTRSDVKDLAIKGLEIKETKEIEKLYPPRFKRELLDYQLLPTLHFRELKSVANFSVPGSGKTTIVLAGYDFLKSDDLVEKLLVIGPYSSLMPWKDEIKACFQDPIPKSTRIHGNPAERHKICLNRNLNSNYEIFLTTYGTARNDIDHLLHLIQQYKFLVVLDESHKIKNIEGITSNIILQLSPHCSAKMILTGTPVPNTIYDLFSQITFIYPGAILGDKEKFKHDTKYSNPRIIEEIKQKINPFFTRISKSQMDLPAPHEELISVPMSPVQTQLYKLVSERWKKIIDLEENLFHFEIINEYKKCLFIRLRQIASNLNLLMERSSEYGLQSLKEEVEGREDIPENEAEILNVINNLENYSDYECAPKILRAVELVKELKEQKNIKKILVWSEFIVNLETLYKYFEEKYGEKNVFLIVGNTPKSKAKDLRNGRYTSESREDYISRFKRNPNEFSILIANPQACAESISLHKICHDAIYVDRSFNCGQFMQSKDRIHRIGLNRDDIITYYYLISTGEDLQKGCIDEKIHERLIEKELKMLEILNDTESFIGYSNEPDGEETEIFYQNI